jgi:hypothetical protein
LPAIRLETETRPHGQSRIGAGTQSWGRRYVIPCAWAQAVAIARPVRPEAPILA